jgi:hypothetical protein
MRSAAVLAGLTALLAGCGPPLVPYGPEETESSEALRIAPACGQPQLKPRLHLQGANGKLLGRLTLRVIGTRRCSVFPTHPRVWLIGTREPVRFYEIEPTLRSESRGPRPPGFLLPGDQVAINLEWSNWCGAPPTALAIAIRFSGTYRMRPPDTPPCRARGRPSQIGVGPVVPIR